VPLHMLGFQNQTQMPAAYAAADVLCLPSDGRETWGLVANEALASGTPITVSDAAGCAPDLTKEAGGGAAFALGDVEELAAVLSASFRVERSRPAIQQLAQSHSLAAAADGVMAAITRSDTTVGA
jgi:glycosyltransferase involved in cell wall biosynthesis